MNIESINQNASNISGVRPDFVYGNLLDQMRYIETLNYIKDLEVLDVASGVGWGSFLMSTVAKSVKGIDLSQEAINTSNKYYSNVNVIYELGNSKQILSEDNSFDAIVSFETLEHIESTNKFLEELYRVGRPNALLLLSTPNGYCTKESKNSKPSNPFHLNEYYKSDLFNLIEEKWNIIEYKGQYPIKKESSEIYEYRKWVSDYWYLNQLRLIKSLRSKIIYLINLRFKRYITNEPAYKNSCRPVEIKDGYEPVSHFVICRSKKSLLK